jgi:hypothetical protein
MMRVNVAYDLGACGEAYEFMSVNFTLGHPSISNKTDRHFLSLKVQYSRGHEVQAHRQNDVGLNTMIMEADLAKESSKSIQGFVGLLPPGNKAFIKGIHPYNIPSVCVA